jgi:LmbE family N-acetylglucosaminyl deacetylase
MSGSTVPLEGCRAAIVAAHPDDETLGAGARLSRFSGLILIHITDGAPRDMGDASAHGFSSCREYAAARRLECVDALRAGGITPDESIALDCPDQEVSWNLAAISRELSRLVERLTVDVILTHPYEGGHPDHDATAFAVHAALRLSAGGREVPLLEFTSYHSRAGQMETGKFLPNGECAETIFRLDPAERARKRRMLDCFRTQQAVLRQFQIEEERFRPAPVYDFAKPPHPGQLYYEQFPWGMTGERWMALAREARKELGLC